MDNPFVLRDNLYAGLGVSLSPASYLNAFDCSHIVVLVDQGVKQNSSYFVKFLGALDSYDQAINISVEELATTQEPDYDYLEEVLEVVRNLASPSLLIGIGGGSTLDITKAVAALRTNPGPALDYRGFDQLIEPGLPTVCIPSTAGTGSEVTYNASFTDLSEMRKMGINGRHMTASCAILDAKWVESCPYPVALSAGMDAMTHCLESFTCRQSTTMSRIISLAAFPMIWRGLSNLPETNSDLASTQELLVGAHLAAAALMNSGSGIASALSYPLSVHYQVPHGIGGGIFLASVIDYNITNGYLGYEPLARQILLDDSPSDERFLRKFLEETQTLMNYLSVPQTLVGWGIDSEELEALGILMSPMQQAFDQNPVSFSAHTDALQMLQTHI